MCRFFQKLEHSQLHSCWPGEDENVDLVEDDVLVEEDEDLIKTIYCNGNNEVVKIFNQKCVICYDRESCYAFRQCGLVITVLVKTVIKIEVILIY